MSRGRMGLEYLSCAEAVQARDAYHGCSTRNVNRLIFSAYHHIRLDLLDEWYGIAFEGDHCVRMRSHVERTQSIRELLRRSITPFETPHRLIGVNGNDEPVAVLAGLSEEETVSGMQLVETAVGESNAHINSSAEHSEVPTLPTTTDAAAFASTQAL